LRNIDILVAREGTAGAYQGDWTTQQDPGEGRKAGHFFGYTEWQVRRFLQASARLARMRRGNLTVVWKESGVPSISALWRDCAAEAAEGSGVEWSMVDVDLMAYRLVQEAPAFDVIAAPNLFGDVLADLGAVLLGSRGASYSGNFTGRGEAVYQTNHGAAYHLAGSDQANPAGQILSLAMMLRETFGLGREAEAVEQALRSVWSEGWRTADVAGPGTRVVGTRELGARVAEHAAAIVREGCEPGCEVG
jgi:3-isopropylmalate dehydrogenase